MSTDPLDPRVTDLEIRAAHYERMADEVSSVVAEHGKTIDILNAQVRRLAERLRELEEKAALLPPDDKPPPHY